MDAKDDNGDWWNDSVNTIHIEFDGTPAGELIGNLNSESKEAEIVYWLQEIYLSLRNPILFFQTASDFSMEFLIAEYVAKIVEKHLPKEAIGVWIEGLGIGETNEQRLFHKGLLSSVFD